MAGETEGNRWWRIPTFIQESLALIFGTLLVASIIGLFNMWSELSVFNIRLGNIEKDLAFLASWKEEFGAKPRWGADDAEKQEGLLRRDIDRSVRRLDMLSNSYYEHDKQSQARVERLGHNEKRTDHVERRLDRLEAQVTGHLNFKTHHEHPQNASGDNNR